jgi:uncharacterized protein YuzE
MEVEFTLDREADAAYIYLDQRGDVARKRQVFVEHSGSYDLVLDFDDDNRLVGLEVIGASLGLTPEFLAGATDVTGTH